MWLLELLLLFSIKYSPKDLLVIHNIKQSLHNLVNELLLSTAHFASKKLVLHMQFNYLMAHPLIPTVFGMEHLQITHKSNEEVFS